MKHLLFITTRPPYPTTKGDQIVAWNRIKALSKSYKVHLLCFHTAPIKLEERWHMEKYCEKVIAIRHSPLKALFRVALGLFGNLPLQISLYFDKDFARQVELLKQIYDYEAIHAVLLRLYSYVHTTSEKTVFELVDSMSLNLGSQIENARGLRRILLELELKRIRRLERRVSDEFKSVLVVSHRDKDALGPGKNIHAIPNGTDLHVIRPKDRPLDRPPTVTFVGNMSYAPNEEAVLWFSQEVWPLLRRGLPSARFLVVGRNPSRKIMDLSGKSGVVVTGAVPSVESYLLDSDVFVAPMRSGSGMQNKIIEAMASGLPVVTTPSGAGGFKEPLEGMLIAPTAEDFARQVARLFADPSLRHRLGKSAQETVDHSYRWRQSNRLLMDVYRGLGLQST